LKIVHIIPNLNIGGAENFCVQLANVQSLEHKIEIIVLNPSDKSSSFISILKSNITLHQLSWLKKYSFVQLVQLNKLIKGLNPEVVHVHLHNAFYYVYAISFLSRKLNVIHTVHNSVDVWRPILKSVDKLRFFNNKIIHVCISKSIQDAFTESFPKLKSKQINNGILRYEAKRVGNEVNLFWSKLHGKKKRGVGFKFLAIGNISKYKNYELLAQVFKDLEKEYPNIYCAIIGRQDIRSEVEKITNIKAKNLYLVGSLHFAADFLSEADALVMSSTQEGMPLVALEALSIGKPIITTPAGGMKDIIQNNYNGFLTCDFAVQSLKQSIVQFITLEQTEREVMAANCLKSFTENYNLLNVKNQYFDIYSNDLAGKK
jgi:glycosyltransferase involved in cell wall biosynthesis